MQKLLTSIPVVLATGFICAASPPAQADPTPTPYPCDARVPHVLTTDPQTGNAIHPYGPPGCDRSLPVIGEH
jgi:hypothetical protein